MSDVRFPMVVAISSAVFIAIACAGNPIRPVKPTTDASPTSIEKACANLAALHCKEAGDTCAPVLTRAMSITPIDVECIANAHTQSEVMQCPAIQCK